MKKKKIVSAVVLAAATCCTFAQTGTETAFQSYAFQGGATARPEYLFQGRPHILSVGAQMENQRRSVSAEGQPTPTDWKARSLLGFVGVDVLPWLTLHGAAGECNLDFGVDTDRGSDFMWAAGAQARLLDYLILDPPMANDLCWLGLEATTQYRNGTSDVPTSEINWHEWRAALTLRLSAHPERFGFVNRVSFYGGPAYSSITGERRNLSGESDFSEEQAYGVLGGLHINPADNFSCRIELQRFDRTTLGASLWFHF